VRQHRNFTETASGEANFRMLEAGRVDYVVASFDQGMGLIGLLGLDGKVQPLLPRSLREDDMYVIFSKERVSPAFVDAFSNALHQFKQTEAFGAISRKYFPATPSKLSQKNSAVARTGVGFPLVSGSAAFDGRRGVTPTYSRRVWQVSGLGGGHAPGRGSEP
jgi:hypothetical protein